MQCHGELLIKYCIMTCAYSLLFAGLIIAGSLSIVHHLLYGSLQPAYIKKFMGTDATKSWYVNTTVTSASAAFFGACLVLILAFSTLLLACTEARKARDYKKKVLQVYPFGRTSLVSLGGEPPAHSDAADPAAAAAAASSHTDHSPDDGDDSGGSSTSSTSSGSDSDSSRFGSRRSRHHGAMENLWHFFWPFGSNDEERRRKREKKKRRKHTIARRRRIIPSPTPWRRPAMP